MKILNAEQIRAADAYTIEHEPIASIDLMERAATRFTEALYHLYPQPVKTAVICGTGNNGGDGLVVSRRLLNRGYLVDTYVVQPKPGGSADFLVNLERLQQLKPPHFITSAEQIPDLSEYDLLIDALFGSGLSRPVTGLFGRVIDKMNATGKPIVAIDMPSGLYMDAPLTNEGAIVRARHTISFQTPKLAFFLPENHPYVGDWQVVDIGLDRNFITGQPTPYTTIDQDEVVEALPERPRFAHKGSFGHGQLIGGSLGKIGAIAMAARAFMRSGAGLLTISVPKCGIDIIQTLAPEAMVWPTQGDTHISDISIFPKAGTVGIGPGMGTQPATVAAFRNFLQHNKLPLVLDADAINIISSHRELLNLLPPGTILTPHPGEFDRLAGNSENHWQRLERALQLAKEYQLVMVVKGAHTAVVDSEGKIAFNTTGNPGMATGGSGDVLLGIITALRTQGLAPVAAARAGVWLHGRAGDLAAADKSQTALLATDIIAYLPQVFHRLGR